MLCCMHIASYIIIQYSFAPHTNKSRRLTVTLEKSVSSLSLSLSSTMAVIWPDGWLDGWMAKFEELGAGWMDGKERSVLFT